MRSRVNTTSNQSYGLPWGSWRFDTTLFIQFSRFTASQTPMFWQNNVYNLEYLNYATFISFYIGSKLTCWPNLAMTVEIRINCFDEVIQTHNEHFHITPQIWININDQILFAHNNSILVLFGKLRIGFIISFTNKYLWQSMHELL